MRELTTLTNARARTNNKLVGFQTGDARTRGTTESFAQRNMESQQSESIEDKSAAKIQAGVRGYLVRKQKRIEKEAATKIQAGFRGYKTRKEIKNDRPQPQHA